MKQSTTRERKADRRDPSTRQEEEGKRLLYTVRLMWHGGRSHDKPMRYPLDKAREGAQHECSQNNVSLASVRILDENGALVEWWHRKGGKPARIFSRETPAPRIFTPTFISVGELEEQKEKERLDRLNRPPFPGYVKCEGFRDCQRWLAPFEAKVDTRCGLCQKKERK